MRVSVPWIVSLVLLVLLVVALRGQASPRESGVLTPLADASDQRQHLQEALDALPPGRTHIASLKLRGEFHLSGTLFLDDYTELDITEARLVLDGAASESLLRNRAGAGGNQFIRILGGVLQGNRVHRKEIGQSCITMQNTSFLHIEGTRVAGCARDGILVDGRGKKPRHTHLSDLLVENNLRDGLIVTWAIRDAVVRDVRANRNARYGVYSDHSESNYLNISAENNGSDGIFIRNVFNNSYHQLRARNNGRHGIAVQGMVESHGSDWRSANNGRSRRDDVAADLFISADGSLSYGINARSVVRGIFAGASRWSSAGKTRYSVWVESPADGEPPYSALGLYDVLADGEVNVPELDGVEVEWRPGQ